MAICGVGLLTFLVVINNLTDYYSNYYFVQPVMKMDTTFPENKLMYRSVNTGTFYHIAYILLIALESLMAFCCLKGAWHMYRNIKKSAVQFHAGKRWAIYGLILGIAIWFIGFEVIGGEWFAMWQSSKWNGLYSADRIVIFIGISLIMLMLKEDDLEVSAD